MARSSVKSQVDCETAKEEIYIEIFLEIDHPQCLSQAHSFREEEISSDYSPQNNGVPFLRKHTVGSQVMVMNPLLRDNVLVGIVRCTPQQPHPTVTIYGIAL